MTPPTDPWLSHPVCSIFAATAILREQLLHLRRTPIPYPGHANIPARAVRERDSERHWRMQIDNCRSLAKSLFGETPDDAIRASLAPALTESLGHSAHARAAKTVEHLLALRRAVSPPPESTGPAWVPPGEWWALGMAALAASPLVTQADVDAEVEARGAPAGPNPRPTLPDSTADDEADDTALDVAAFGDRVTAMCGAAAVVANHLARPEPTEDGLTQAALAFRELAVAHQCQSPADLFKRLAGRGQPYKLFISHYPGDGASEHFAGDSASEALWHFAVSIRAALVRAIVGELASGEVESNRVTLGLVHPSELARVHGQVREWCRAWWSALDRAPYRELERRLADERDWLGRQFDVEVRMARLEADLTRVAKNGAASRRGKKESVYARILIALEDDPKRAFEWTTEQWAEHLGCAESTVKESKAWDTRIKPARALMRLEYRHREEKVVRRRKKSTG